MAKQPLRCWWNDVHVADFTATKPWDLRCKYTDAALERWPTNTRLLSVSLPVQQRPQRATPFLRGVLPEGAHLQRLAQDAGIAANDVRGLLARYGRDVAGALTFIDGDEPPDPARWDVAPYTEDTLAREVLGLEEGLGVRDDSELSLAGLWNKFVLVDLGDGTWGRPVHGHPSTHILKVDVRGYDGLVDLEGQCLALAQELGLTNVEPLVTEIGGRLCLIVRRYDRTGTGEQIGRIHQEDACQALAVDSEDHRRRGKYEEHGGPSLEAISRRLLAHARDPDAELERLVRMVTFTHLIGNADAHGKNVSYLHDMDGHITLAPLYDTVPTAIWPNLRATAAMSVNGRWSFDEIGLDDIATEAHRWRLNRDSALVAAAQTVEASLALVPEVIRDLELADLIRSNGERLLATVPS
jgi:serine/threonine-protein kinase HipA